MMTFLLPFARRLALILVAGLLVWHPAGAQQAASVAGTPLADKPGTHSDPAADDGPAIVVNGIRYPVKVDTKSFVDIGAVEPQAAADARFFSQCVQPADNKSLHELIDGVPNRAIRGEALDRIIRAYAACYPSFNSLMSYDGCIQRQTLDPKVIICEAFFDRGALIERVLARYAPDLSFTSTDFTDPAVLARFHARQDKFNTTRAIGERVYAEVTTCLVAVHPDLSLFYIRSDPNSEGETRSRSALIGSSPECLGGAKKAVIDPAQFRVYMADAIYDWAVAVRGGDTLLPLPPHRFAVDGWRKSDF